MSQDPSIYALLDKIDVPAQRGKLPAYPPAPAHYVTTHGRDTYDVLREVFGEGALQDHMLMEATQYIVRAKRKGTYADDLRKVIAICQRLLTMENTP
jgi:hypothetical protein